jgi:hypothetical protein
MYVRILRVVIFFWGRQKVWAGVGLLAYTGFSSVRTTRGCAKKRSILYLRYTLFVEEMIVLLVTNIDAYVDLNLRVSDVRHAALYWSVI